MSEPGDVTGPLLLDALRGVLAEVAEPVQVLRTILEQALKRTGADRGVLVELDERGGFEYRVLHRFEPSELRGEAGAFSRSVFETVVRNGTGLLLDNALRTPGLMNAQSVQTLRMISVLCEPILVDGHIVALVHLENGRPGHFKAVHRELLHSLLGLAGPVIEMLRAGRRVLDERDALREQAQETRVELAESRALLARDWSFGRFVGRAPVVQELERTVLKAAATSFPVLLVGETGTGKGLLARILHFAGERAAKPFATVFCPSLERGMIESELFGHRRGAFTGALEDRTGKVPAANGGTLLLDEVGELPLEYQPKILRLLQEKTYERLGDATEHRADVRIIAATNRDLALDVQSGRFRRDLFERLNYVPIRVPPLRERRTDIPLLLRHCLDAHPSGRWIEIAPEGEAWLVEVDFLWPGNVRHIEQLAARLSMEHVAHPIGARDLARLLSFESDPASTGADELPIDAGLPALMEQAEREWLARALAAYPDLTRRELAARLKISEPSLYKKLRQYGL